MHSQIAELRRQAETEIAAVSGTAQLDEFRIKFLARKGSIATLFEALKTVPAVEKPALGKALNELRVQVQNLYDQKANSLAAGPVSTSALDLTLPGRRSFRG